MTAPTTLNGYKVLSTFHTPSAAMTREGYVVLVDRERDFHRYVTAWAGAGDTSWHQGHYITDREAAGADFQACCKRGY